MLLLVLITQRKGTEGRLLGNSLEIILMRG